MSQQTLDDIKAKATAYSQDLLQALQLLEQPDISNELDDIKKKLNIFRAQLADTLDSLHYPELGAAIQRLTDEANVHLSEIQKGVNALGYPNVVDEYEKAKAKRDAYSLTAWEMVRDLDTLARQHASDYAARRKAEMMLKLTQIDNA